MRKFGIGLPSLVICGLLLIPAYSANKTVVKTVTPPPPPDYFPLGKDYWWQYKTRASTGDSEFELKVVNIEKKPDETYVYQIHTQPKNASSMGAGGFDEWYVKPRGLVETLKIAFNGKETDYSPERKFLVNPLKVGETWTWEGSRMPNVTTTENSKVETLEDIEVPAGKFKAMRVTTDIVQGGSPMTKTYWYAPWVGLVQSKTQSGTVTSTSQLVKYVFPRPDKDKDKTITQ